MNLTRIWESLTGKPHRHENAEAVSSVAKRLSDRADELNNIMRPYRESEDPLVMLLTDAIIQRGLRRESGWKD